ncbi:unnamed protein product [Peronospora belbahrii]|uniref:Uncharacterized protein n=1 Tax=Peronospora belbahrii TaxID=622444 RepID=A0ABN8CNC0_9STRA|nr:unnamed protein product [Peronospora belbahrii]
MAEDVDCIDSESTSGDSVTPGAAALSVRWSLFTSDFPQFAWTAKNSFSAAVTTAEEARCLGQLKSFHTVGRPGYKELDAIRRLQQNEFTRFFQQKKRNLAVATADRRFVKQNIREFRKQVRIEWLSAWRGMPPRDRSEAWCIQETYVSTSEKAGLEQQWRRRSC